MEQNVLRMLEAMIGTTDDEEIKSDLRRHKLETEQHVERIQRRLEAHDASPSMVREAGGIMAALMKGAVDMVRNEKAGRNARDGYATEHLEIASYQLLERIAERGRGHGDGRGRPPEPGGRGGDGQEDRRSLGQVRRALAERGRRHGLTSF